MLLQRLGRSMFSRHALPSCRRKSAILFRRSLTTPANAQPSTSSSPSQPPKRPPRPELKTAIILNRSPQITRTPTVFERAYHAYQARIQRALRNPFPYEFYFKPGSPLEARFNMEERRRERKAFGKPFGVEESSGQGEDGKAPVAVDNILQLEGEGEESQPRIHQADVNGNVKSLDRKGQRNIYLLVKENGKEVWRFPEGSVEQGELLHQAAERDLYAECGTFMDTWIVSRNPVGVYTPTSLQADDQALSRIVTFFFKGHIMAGQARPDGKQVQDFAWLTKEEIELRVDNAYWLGVKDMLSDF